MSKNNLYQKFTGHSWNALLSCLLLLAVFSLASCGGDDDDGAIAPKPRAYYRLHFPEKKYVRYDSTCPFTCEIPAYAQMHHDAFPGAEPCWLNLDFPSFHGTLHLSYKEANGNFDTLLENTYDLAYKHQIKASGIREQLIDRPDAKVYGLLYDIGGNAASSIQFFLIDSTKHFIRGALYFEAVPNTDSIKPVVEYIRKDIYHLIETFAWKDHSGSLTQAVDKKQGSGK